MDLVNEALKLINIHKYAICKKCNKRCKTYCLPVEMFVILTDTVEDSGKITMLENVSHLFKDEEGD